MLIINLKSPLHLSPFNRGLQINTMEIKAKFHFVSEASAESKSTVVKVKRIQLTGQEEIFLFPENKQTSVQHSQLFETTIVKNVVKSLKVRNKFRNVVLTLSDELRNIYLDTEGNVVFYDEYLEEVSSALESDVKKDSTGTVGRQISSLVKEMVIDKFNGENLNASVWIKLFVQECDRVGVDQNKYTEVLRLFLEKSALDWYNVFLKQNSLSNWEAWNNSFVDTFSAQSWSDIAYAYNFKFYNGSLLEFALKKRMLLLEIDESISINTQINMIVISLPNYIQNKLERKSIVNIENLMAKLKQFGKLNNSKNDNVIKKSLNEKRPCNICDKLGFKNRFHSESVCRNKDRQVRKIKNENVKVTNNSEIQEVVASYQEAKNE